MFPSPIGELHFSIRTPYYSNPGRNCFRPLSGSYISQCILQCGRTITFRFRPLSGSYISQSMEPAWDSEVKHVSVPYRGATFLNEDSIDYKTLDNSFRPLSGSYISQFYGVNVKKSDICFRPLSGSYISQYHPRNPMFCLGQIGGLRGKSNFIEMQPFWKVKNSHKSNI